MQSIPQKIISFVIGFSILLIVYFVGELVAALIPFPIPGSVVGLLFIFILLQTKVIKLEWVSDASGFLLSFLGLFYVPYGVGIIDANQFLQGKAWVVVLSVVVVTVLVFGISGKTFTFFSKKTESKE